MRYVYHSDRADLDRTAAKMRRRYNTAPRRQVMLDWWKKRKAKRRAA